MYNTRRDINEMRNVLSPQILHAQHNLKHTEILQKLDVIASSVKEPNITVHLVREINTLFNILI